MMHAAVVRAFDRPPRYEALAVPEPGPGQIRLDVVAAGLHPRVRSGANNSHYTSDGVLPMVPGVDGVGRRADGQLVFFVADDTGWGTMADHAVVDERRTVELPPGIDPVVAAAAVNPAMSSWVALRRRIELEPGQRVLVLGATGNAGQLAIDVAKRLGAGQVVAAGRDPDRLAACAALGAEVTVGLTGPADEVARALAAAAEVDVVLDYLWGAPAEQAMSAGLSQRRDRGRRLSWIQIGAVAGPTMALPSAFLRSADLHLVGSGQGSVTAAGYLAEFPSLLAELAEGQFTVSARAVPLADVEAAWTSPERSGDRIVLTPGS